MAKRNLEKNSETAFLEFPRIYHQQKNLMSSTSVIPHAECQRKEVTPQPVDEASI